MNIKLKFLSSITFIAILAGCGGGGGSNATATAYYKDSSVEGVEYHCGSQTGVTNKDGAFSFEVGQNCEMKLADLTLRNVSANELFDGKIIVEDNPTVAAFLQSLDVDGDPDNGITITKEEMQHLKSIIKEERINHIPKDSELEVVVEDMHHKSDSYHGHAVSEKVAIEHVNKHKLEYEKHNQEIEKEHHKNDEHNNGGGANGSANGGAGKDKEHGHGKDEEHGKGGHRM